MLNFEKPIFKITEYVDNNFFGKFEVEPLERGFGITLGNSLRRIMLSSLPGSAIIGVKIDGALHEFQALEGVIEDVTMIILNLKNVVIKNHTKETKVVRLVKEGEGPVYAGDFNSDSDVEIINKDFVIANLAKDGKISMEIVVDNGRGYTQSEENKLKLEKLKLGFIPIDSSFSPIENVIYEVEPTRVGQDSSFDKLVLSVTTNGAIKPEEAVALSSKVLIEHLKILTNLNEIADMTGVMSAKKEDKEMKKLETPIEDLELSVRAFNCLKKSEIDTVSDLIAKTESEMMKVRNLGKKSLKEVIDKIKDMGLEFKDEE